MTRRDIFKMFAGVAGIPAVKSVETLDVKKDDTIVLKFEEHLRPSAVGFIRDTMAEKFPGQKVMILDNGASVEVLRARHG